MRIKSRLWQASQNTYMQYCPVKIASIMTNNYVALLFKNFLKFIDDAWDIFLKTRRGDYETSFGRLAPVSWIRISGVQMRLIVWGAPSFKHAIRFQRAENGDCLYFIYSNDALFLATSPLPAWLQNCHWR